MNYVKPGKMIAAESLLHKLKSFWNKGTKWVRSNSIIDYLYWQYIYIKIKLSSWPVLGVIFKRHDAAAQLDDLEGALTDKELNWLYKQVCKLPDGSVIVELGCEAGQATCCLSLGCVSTRKRVYSVWDNRVCNPATTEARMYCTWHQNIIRKYLVPYVIPVQFKQSDSIEKVSLLCVNTDSNIDAEVQQLDKIKSHLDKGCMVVLYQKQKKTSEQKSSQLTSFLNQPLVNCGVVGSLMYGFVNK